MPDDSAIDPSFRAQRSGVEESRGGTMDFATGFLDFARNDSKSNLRERISIRR
jgi:hypothetical protein